MTKEKPVFRRILAPLVLLLGLSLSFLGGVNVLKMEKKRWQASLVAESEAELSQLTLSWQSLEAGTYGIEQLFAASEEVTQREFTYVARQLMEQFSYVTGLIYLPPQQGGAASPYRMPYVHPNRRGMDHLQTILAGRERLASPLHILKPPKDAGLASTSLVYARRLGLSGELGALFTVFNVDEMARQALGKGPSGLLIQVFQGATPLLAYRPSGGLDRGGETAKTIQKKTTWGGASWQLTWSYAANKAGGVNYLPAALLFIVGGGDDAYSSMEHLVPSGGW
jgi:hypothetical protein